MATNFTYICLTVVLFVILFLYLIKNTSKINPDSYDDESDLVSSAPNYLDASSDLHLFWFLQV